MNAQPRIHPGVPSGGQYTFKEHGEPGTVLPVDWAHRARMLEEAGYVPAVATGTAPSQAGPWWGQQFSTAEYGHPEGAYPQMPDDNTPSMTPGNALSGHRRTYRSTYRGVDGAMLRMTSRASIDRFAGENLGTFDIPVTYASIAGEYSGWVRATRGPGGTWRVDPVGTASTQALAAAESAAAVLEARRPSRPFDHVGDLLELRRRRTTGAAPTTVSSSWIAAVGYNDQERVLTVTTARGDTYGYKASPELYAKLAGSTSPGREYNQLVKGKREPVAVGRCPACSRFYSDRAPHHCPVAVTDRGPESVHALKARMVGTRVASHRAPATASVDTPQLRVARWMQDEMTTAVAAGTVDPSAHPFGNDYRRGFTIDAATEIADLTDPAHCASLYRGGRHNGDTGVLGFAGLDAAKAETLHAAMPASILDRSENGAPPLRQMLRAVSHGGGTVEARGFVVPPNRADERVAVTGLYLYTDERDPSVVESLAKTLRLHAQRRPTLTETTVPWRGNRKAWLLSW